MARCRSARKLAIRLAQSGVVLAFVPLYLAAKLHFVRAFRINNVGDYVGAHWPYWAAMVGFVALLVLLERAAGRSDAPEEPRPS